jgi:cytoskeletal protein CcmA (bactofilin family)
MTRFLRRAAALLAALVLIAITATMVFGVETRLLDGKLRTGDSVTVPAAETWDGNLYLFAGQITVDGSVDGDLTAFGGTVTVNGAVTGDLLVAGGRVLVVGTVDGDIRAAGGQVEIPGSATGDALISGGQVTLIAGSSIGGDVIVSGGQVTVDGDVEGSVVGTAGRYSSSGTIGGENSVEVPEDLPPENAAGTAAFNGIRQFLLIVVVGGLMLLFVPRVLRAADTTLRTSPVGSFVGGILACLAYLGFVIVAVLATLILAVVFVIILLGPLAAFSILGGILAVGLVSYLFLLAVLYLADVVIALGLAHVVSRPGPDESRWRELLLLALGAVVVVVVTSLPVVGGLAKLLVVLFGLGALAYAWWRWRKRNDDDVDWNQVPDQPPSAPTPTAAG